jgi:hypothetical protein
MDSLSSTSSEESLPIKRKGLRVDESEYSDDEEFIEDWERKGGAEVSFVSNGTTLIAQSPTRTSVTKRCSRCRYFEGARRSGVLVEFDVNPRSGKKYSECRGCKVYKKEISNPKSNLKVSLPTYLPISPMKLSHQLQLSLTHLLLWVEISRGILASISFI